MALLSEASRAKVWKLFMSLGHCPSTILKSDAKTALDALDQWLDDNALAINGALPQPFRGQATAEQKALLLAYICLERAGVL